MYVYFKYSEYPWLPLVVKSLIMSDKGINIGKIRKTVHAPGIRSYNNFSRKNIDTKYFAGT